ncbi:hypothetical protein AHiyo8_25780 [Arthrobacter sp. Hiyo8]|nr:hypothetical protein AHiyo8_25780 [Arthrobacter sp. Hiyo8]
MKLTGTNRPTTYTTQTRSLLASTMWFPNNNPFRNKPQLHNNTTEPFTGSGQVVTTYLPTRTHVCAGTGNRVTAVIAWGKRPVPFRTRKLRPTAPMVLHPGGCGRVGHRRTTIHRPGPDTPCRGLTHLTHPNTRHTSQPPLTYGPVSPDPRSDIGPFWQTPARIWQGNPKPRLTYPGSTTDARRHSERASAGSRYM